MLRITVHAGEGTQTIKLEGKVAGPFVDAKGSELLREIYQKANVRFLVDSPLTRYFADDAMQRSPKGGEEGV
jgi:hypothetical protein